MQAQSEETKPLADENGPNVTDATDLPRAPDLPPPELVDAASAEEEDSVAAPEPAAAEADPSPSASEQPSAVASAPADPPGARAGLLECG